MTTTPPAPFTLPAPVGALLSRLPAYPGSMLLVTAINFALAKQLPQDVKDILRAQRLAIRVRDARVAFDFSWNGQRFVPCKPQAETDLAISANAQDFLLLAQRRQDPDTLFFNRRLVMEGDTELGGVRHDASPMRRGYPRASPFRHRTRAYRRCRIVRPRWRLRQPWSRCR